MSLSRSIVKLNAFKPMKMAARTHWYGTGFNHVIIGPPTVRMPWWKQSMFMGTFVVAMYTYPLYVTYMMFEWDRMDNNF